LEYIFLQCFLCLLSYPLGALLIKIGLKIVLLRLLLFVVVYGSIGFVDCPGLILYCFFPLWLAMPLQLKEYHKALIQLVYDRIRPLPLLYLFGSLATLIAPVSSFIWMPFSRFVLLFRRRVLCVTITWPLFWLGRINLKN